MPEDRVQMDMERVQHWLAQGAQPTDRVSRFLVAAGVKEKTDRKNLKKGEPGKKALDRVKMREDKAEAVKQAEEDARQAAEDAKNAPAAEAPADEAPADAASE